MKCVEPLLCFVRVVFARLALRRAGQTCLSFFVLVVTPAGASGGQLYERGPRQQALDPPTRAEGAVGTGPAWQWREPLPQGNALHAVAANRRRYVAVGDAGTILFSEENARSWTLVAPIVRESLFDVAFGDGTFVAVGASGTVIRSTDGEVWYAVDCGTDADLREVSYGLSGFAAVGGTTLATSPDGLTWAIVDTVVDPPGGGLFPPSFNAVSYGNGRYVALVDLGPDLAQAGEEARVLTSTDGVLWQAHPFRAPAGSSWVGAPVFFRGLAFGEGLFVSAGINADGVAFTFASSDGLAWSWELAPTDEFDRSLLVRGGSIAYDSVNGRFVAVAQLNDPPLPFNFSPWIVASEDGLAWSPRTMLTGRPIERISFVRDRLFGLTYSSEIYTSVEGSAWALTTAPAQAALLTGLWTNGSTMVASGVGPAGVPTDSEPFDGLILNSSDGTIWNVAALPVPQTFVVKQISELARGGGVFVAFVLECPIAAPCASAGSQAFYVSIDGVTWSRVELLGQTETLSVVGAAYGNGAFVMTAYGGDYLPVVLRSVDQGATWQRFDVAGVNAPLGAVVHGDDGFLAIPPDFGTMAYRSLDGVVWSGVDAWPESGGRLVDVAHHDGVYLIAGQAFEDGQPVDWLLRSTDGGLGWSARRADEQALEGLSSNRSGFVLGAVGGATLFSFDGLSWTASWTGAHSGVVGSVEDDQGRQWIATRRGGLLEGVGPLLFGDGFETANTWRWSATSP